MSLIVKCILMHLCLLIYSIVIYSSLTVCSVVGLSSQCILKFPSPQTDKLSPVSLTPASVETALMGEIDIIFLVFFFSSSAADVTGRDVWGADDVIY